MMNDSPDSHSSKSSTTGAESAPQDEAPDQEAAADAGVRCDFCNAVVPSVRRVALDGDYERLRTRHNERYACAACSERKEQERLGLSRG
jgi:hypothetical protein